MKNLMCYTGPARKFDEECEVLTRIQIDNSLDLGWKKEDILLFTDFEYEYNGVRSIVVPDDLYCAFDKKSNKMLVITHLLLNGIVDEDQLYWYHDFDAYENSKIEESELGLGDVGLGLTTYGYKPDWNCGCFFFRRSAEDIFALIVQTMFNRRPRPRADEKALQRLTDDSWIDENRYRKLNTTYNITMRDVAYSYSRASKPLKVLHFHPYTEDDDYKLPDKLLNTFMYGRNRMGIPLMSERLIKIFHYHGIK